MYKFGAFSLLVLLSTSAFADDLTTLLLPNTVIPNGCNVSTLGEYENSVQMIPVYEYNTYTCEAGYYLPANNTECLICPENSYCVGGDYLFSEVETKGLAGCPTGMISAAGSANESDCITVTVCEPGYYVDANESESSICPRDHYCSGGTFAFSDTASGITRCPEGLVAPEGATSVEECGKMMRIGDDVMYLTTEQKTSPAMAVSIDGAVYYAMTTPLSEGPRYMNKDSRRQLRMRVDGVEYSIHDITSKGE